MTKKPIDRRRRRSETKPSKRKQAAPEAVRDDEHRDDLPRPSKSRQRPIPAKSPAAGERRTRSKSKATQAATPRRRRTSSGTRDYAVGRGKPPPEYTWKPGESGNKKGRPKGSKNEATIWKEIMRRKIPMQIGGKLKEVMIQEGIQYRIANDALKGNVKSASFVLNRVAGIVTDIADTNMTEDDLAVLKAYKRRIKKETPEDDDDD